MREEKLLERFGAHSLGSLCNADSRVLAFGVSIRPLEPGTKVVGRAKTARISPGQNGGIHRAVHTAEPGDVLVVDGGNTQGFGPFGDILATNCMRKGIVGLVISSTVRDVTELRALRFPVFCMGANPTSTGKVEVGEVDIQIVCGTAKVNPADIVVGSDDGVVVVPSEFAEEIADKADAVAAKEQGYLQSISAGKTTYQILELGSRS